jgi:hypothetical protein
MGHLWPGPNRPGCQPMAKQRRRSGHGARRWRRPESGKPVARGGRESDLGRRWVHGKSDLGVEARRISPVRGAPWWRSSGRKEPPAAGRRSGGGRHLGGCRAAVSSGRGRGSDGSLGGRLERPVCAVMLILQGSGDGEHDEENVKGKPSALSSQRI